MIVKVNIGEFKDIDLKKELSLASQRVETLISDNSGDPLVNLKELAMQSLRLIELYKLFEKS